MLVEALVAASLLVILSLGFLAALDVAARQSGSNESRAVGASLAQDEIERLRALKVRDLVGLNATREQAVDGVRYTIASRAQWVDDTAGTTTCPTLGATKSDYLKVTSTVTWPFMGTVQPVRSETLVAVPLGSLDGSRGGLIVRIQDRVQSGVAGIPATLSGPAGAGGTSDADGCIFWGDLLPGSYQVSFSRNGWVDRRGDTAISRPATVTGGATNAITLDYDRAAKIDAAFDTQVSGVGKTGRARAITVANSGIPGAGLLTFSSSSAATSISTGHTLFPFLDAYAVWAGGCAGADPRQYGQSTPTTILGSAGTGSATLRVPALNIQVTRSGSPYPSARVRITPATPGCGSVYDGGALTSSGSLQDPGQPYGDYHVCADDGTRRAQTSSPVQNRSPAGTATVSLAIPTSWWSSTGTCA